MGKEDYVKALKSGKKDYQARMMRGEKPTLLVLDDIMPMKDSYTEVPLGLVQIPTERLGVPRLWAGVILLPETSCPFYRIIQNLPANGPR